MRAPRRLAAPDRRVPAVEFRRHHRCPARPPGGCDMARRPRTPGRASAHGAGDEGPPRLAAATIPRPAAETRKGDCPHKVDRARATVEGPQGTLRRAAPAAVPGYTGGGGFAPGHVAFPIIGTPPKWTSRQSVQASWACGGRPTASDTFTARSGGEACRGPSTSASTGKKTMSPGWRSGCGSRKRA